MVVRVPCEKVLSGDERSKKIHLQMQVGQVIFVDIFWILHPGSFRFALKKAGLPWRRHGLLAYPFPLHSTQRQVKFAIGNNCNFVKDIQVESYYRLLQRNIRNSTRSGSSQSHQPLSWLNEWACMHPTPFSTPSAEDAGDVIPFRDNIRELCIMHFIPGTLSSYSQRCQLSPIFIFWASLEEL